MKCDRLKDGITVARELGILDVKYYGKDIGHIQPVRALSGQIKWLSVSPFRGQPRDYFSLAVALNRLVHFAETPDA